MASAADPPPEEMFAWAPGASVLRAGQSLVCNGQFDIDGDDVDLVFPVLGAVPVSASVATLSKSTGFDDETVLALTDQTV